MSKRAGRNPQVSSFGESLPSLPMAQVEANRKSASSRLQSGIQTMFEAARKDGFEAGREEGFLAGLEEGSQKGRQEFEEAHAEALASFRSALESFVAHAEEAVEDWYRRAEDRLAGLAVEIARRAVCRELSIDRECIFDIAVGALAQVREGTRVRVKVNPLDAGALESRREAVLAAASGIRALEVCPDLNVQAGCLVETEAGFVDARIESYLERLEAAA